MDGMGFEIGKWVKSADIWNDNGDIGYKLQLFFQIVPVGWYFSILFYWYSDFLYDIGMGYMSGLFFERRKMKKIKDFIYGALSLIGFGILFVCGLFIVAIIVAAFWAITIPFLIVVLIISIFSLLLN